MEREEIHNNKVTGRIYVSKPFPQLTSLDETGNPANAQPINVRIMSKVIDSEEQFTHAVLKDELVLRKTSKGRQEIIAKFYEDTRGITVLTFQRYTSPSGKPHESSFSFIGDEIAELYYFIENVNYIPIDNPMSISYADSTIENIKSTKEQTINFILENKDLIHELITAELDKEDVIALGYRKKQLDVFGRMLNDDQYFQNLKQAYQISSDEALWQRFFEKNNWIFGYGLSYVFNTPLDDKKLEQYVSGYDFNSSGKRIDAFLKTKGLIESFCFAEIKTHKTGLLKQLKTAYRPESWQISDELGGALAQVQRTVQKSIENIKTKTEIKDGQGFLTGEKVYLYNPKAFIVVGSLGEFFSDNGVNEEKFSSFEMFRQSINKIEIITFDELYQRASFIVKSHS